MVVGDEQLVPGVVRVDVYFEPERIGGNEVGQRRYLRLSQSHKNPMPSIEQGGQTRHYLWKARQQVLQSLETDWDIRLVSGHRANRGDTPLQREDDCERRFIQMNAGSDL